MGFSLHRFVYLAFQFYFILLIIRIFLSWLSVDWYKQPFVTIKNLCDPYLNIFRFIPPIGGVLDVSPILAILLLQIMQTIITNLIYSIGL